jgi:hypothetical protein
MRWVFPAAALLLLGACVSLGGLSGDSSDAGDSSDSGSAHPDGAESDASSGTDALPSDDGGAPDAADSRAPGPLPITTNAPMSDASALAAGNALLAWTDPAAGNVYETPFAGDGGVLAIAAQQATPTGIVSGGALGKDPFAWVDGLNGQVWEYSGTGAAMLGSADAGASGQGIAHAGSFYYWGANAGGSYTIFTAVDDGTAFPQVIVSGAGTVQAVAADSNAVYYAVRDQPSATHIFKKTFTAGSATSLYTIQSAVQLALCDTTLYWLNAPAGGQPGSIEVGSTTGAPKKTVAAALPNPGGVACDPSTSDGVWTDSTLGTVFRGSDVGNAHVIAAGQDAPGAIAVAPFYVYWLNVGTRTIMRLHK